MRPLLAIGRLLVIWVLLFEVFFIQAYALGAYWNSTAAGKVYLATFTDESGNVVVGTFRKKVQWDWLNRRANITEWDDGASFVLKEKDGIEQNIPNTALKDRVIDLQPNFTGTLRGNITDATSRQPQVANKGTAAGRDLAEVETQFAKTLPNIRPANVAGRLIAASAAGDLTRVQGLLADGANVNEIIPGGHYTTLMNAAREGYLQVVEVLLTAGADVNAKDAYGATALQRGAEQCHANVVRALLAAKADVNARAADGTTAMILASQRGCPEVVQLLKASLEKASGSGTSAQPPDLIIIPVPAQDKGSGMSSSRFVLLKGKNGAVTAKGVQTMFLDLNSGKVAQMRPDYWGLGGEHAFQVDYTNWGNGKFAADIATDRNFPITFKVTDTGYAYISGRGTISIKEGKRYKFGYEISNDMWIAGINSPYQLVREGSCEAAGRLGLNAAVPSLIEALKDPAWEVRRNAAEALGLLGDVKAVHGLEEAATDREPNVSKAANEALQQIRAGAKKESGGGFMFLTAANH